MFGSATLATEVSNTSMKVASMTETAISQGLNPGFHASAACTVLDSALIVVSRCSLHRDFRIDRHARADGVLRIRLFIKDDLHRHALDNFDIVAGRVFRRQNAESSSGSALDTVHMAFEHLAGIGVDLDFGRLPRANVVQLSFLE